MSAGKHRYLHVRSLCGDSTSCLSSSVSVFLLIVTFLHTPRWPFTTSFALLYAACQRGINTVPSSRQRPRGISHSLFSNYPARALMGENPSCRDLPQSRHSMPCDDTAQKTMKVAWSRNEDTWKQASPPFALHCSGLQIFLYRSPPKPNNPI